MISSPEQGFIAILKLKFLFQKKLEMKSWYETSKNKPQNDLGTIKSLH